jgi:hypothetical protein
MSSSQPKRGGSIDAQNFLKRFFSMGFSYTQCLLELIDNSIDAKATKIFINLNPNEFIIFDNGIGMNGLGFRKYFYFCSDKSEEEHLLNPMGSKGLGGKIASVILSNLGNFRLISKMESHRDHTQTSFNWNEVKLDNDITWTDEATRSSDAIISKCFEDYGKWNSYTYQQISLCPEAYAELSNNLICIELATTYSRYIKENEIQIIFNGKLIKYLEIIPDIKFNLPHIEKTFYKKKFFILNDSNSEGKLIIASQDNEKFYDYSKRSLIEVQQNDIIGSFDITYSFYYDINLFIEEYFDKYIDSVDYFEKDFIYNKKELVEKLFYGTHIIRNNKVIIQPFIRYEGTKEGGDHHLKKAKFNNHFVIEYNTKRNDDVLDKLFNVLINKSALATINKELDNFFKNFKKNEINKTVKNYDESYKKLKEQEEKEKLKQAESVIVTEKETIKTNITQIKPPVETKVNPLAIQETPKNTPKSKSISIQPRTKKQKTIDTSLEPNNYTKEESVLLEIKTAKEKITHTEVIDEVENVSHKKPRKGLNSKDKINCFVAQHGQESLTGIKFDSEDNTQNILRYHKDHIDGDRSNSDKDNFQLLTPNLHDIKTHNPALYEKIEKTPEIFIFTMLDKYLDTNKTREIMTENGKATEYINFKKIVHSILLKIPK